MSKPHTGIGWSAKAEHPIGSVLQKNNDNHFHPFAEVPIRHFIFLIHLLKNIIIILTAFLAVITTLLYIFLPTIFENMLHHTQTNQGLAFGAALIAIIILCFYKHILDHTLSQTKSAYTRYVKSYIYTKNFLWFITLRAIMILCISQAIWFLCDHLHINILNKWFDDFLSPEHWILSFALAAITFQALHQKALQKSKDNIYKYYQTRGRYISKDTKAYVRKRDKGRCRKCRSRKKLEYDHIKPYSKGGKNTPNNIQLLCRKCNRSKGAKRR